MLKKRPEINPRISTEQIKSSPKIGKGVDFDAKYKKLKDKGCFPQGAQSKAGLKKTLYLPPNNKSQHFENLLRDDKNTQFIKQEFDFFKDCIVYAYGPNAFDHITDKDLLLDKADVLFSKLEGTPTRDVTTSDPVFDILELAQSSRQKLRTKILKAKTRFTGSDVDRKISVFSEDPFTILSQNDRIKLGIRKDYDELTVKTGPIVLILAYENKYYIKGQELRAQIEQHVHLEPEVIPHGDGTEEQPVWLCETKKRDYLSLKGVTGSFCFLVLANVGKDILHLLPQGTDPRIISTEALGYLYKHLNTVAEGKDDIVYGLANYQIT